MKISNEFSGLSYCLIIKVHCFCCSRFYRSSLTSLPQLFVFVKHFFKLFKKSFFRDFFQFLSLLGDSFVSITPISSSVNTFFKTFLSLFFPYFSRLSGTSAYCGSLCFSPLYIAFLLCEQFLQFFSVFWISSPETSFSGKSVRIHSGALFCFIGNQEISYKAEKDRYISAYRPLMFL